MADVELNGSSIKGTTVLFIEGDVVYGTYGECPPGNKTVATVTVYRWNIQSSSYVIVNQWPITLGPGCESGSWTLHAVFNGQQPPCGTANAYSTANQLYCPCNGI